MARRRERAAAKTGGATAEKQKIHMMVKVSMILWIIGFLMVLSAIYMVFWGPFQAIADSTSSRMLMTFKLGGIGFILSGIFISLIGILKVLSMMPQGLKAALRGR